MGTAAEGLRELGLSAFGEALAAPDQTPGLEAAVAAQVASGLALVSMAFRAEGGESLGPWRLGRADELDSLRARALDELVSDATARAAWEGASSADRQRRAHDFAEVPMELAEIALAGLRIAAAGAPGAASNPDDVAAGALLLRSAAEAAAIGLRRRASLVEDEAWRVAHAGALEQVLRESRAHAQALVGARAD